MNKSEYRKKQEEAERKHWETAEKSDRQQVIGALERIAEQNEVTESQAQRADKFHRRIEKLTLRLDGRKFWLELAETAGLWAAAAVGVIAILVSSYDSEKQRRVMEGQQMTMQGQLDEMKATEAQTTEMIATNRNLAEAASKQAQAAIDSAKTAQENMVASQRAWVGPRLARSDKAPGLDKETSVVIEYQNTGREPAREAIYDVDVFTANDEKDMSGEVATRIVSFIHQCEIKWTPTQATVVFPATNGFGGSSYIITRTIEASMIDQDVIDSKKKIFASGCIVYKTAGGIHRSSFCYFFKAGKTPIAGWNICQVGNDAD